MKKLFIALLFSLISLSAWAANPQVTLETSMGTIKVELYPDAAPKTVENFLKYVNDGFYNGTIFHRVIGSFMIQGGGMDAEMNEKATRAPVKNEGALNQKANLKNTYGTLAMARRPDPDSATAQFFINVADNPFLDYPQNGGYTVFGKVIDGTDVVNAIAAVPTGSRKGHRDVPNTPVVIIKASVVGTPATKQ